MTDDEETAGLLALILVHHGRRPARTRRDGSPVPLAGRTAPAGTPRSSPRPSQSCRQRWAVTDSVTSKPRPLSPPCTPTRRAPRRPTGCRSSAGRTSCSGSPTARSCSSTGPSPSARPMAPWPASRPRRPWTLPCPGTPPPRRTSMRRRATLGPRHGCTPTPPGPPPISPSATTSPAGSADQSSAARTSPLVNPSHKVKPATGTAQDDEVSPRVVHKTRPVKIPAQVPLTGVRIDHFAPTCAPDDGVAVQIDPAETKAFVAKLVAAADATPPRPRRRLPLRHRPPRRRPPGRRPPRHRPRPQRRTRRPPA